MYVRVSSAKCELAWFLLRRRVALTAYDAKKAAIYVFLSLAFDAQIGGGWVEDKNMKEV